MIMRAYRVEKIRSIEERAIATQGVDVFRACRDEIKRCLEKSVPRLLMLLSG